MLRFSFYLLLPLFVFGCGLGGKRYQHLELADEHIRAGEIELAIDQYNAHMRSRLAIEDRPEWENPYFYLLSIGDLWLKLENVDKALANYLEAEEKGVSRELISDRLRMTARWLEERKRYADAIKLLGLYRDRDPLLFDAMLDRLSKELVAEEDRLKSSQ